VFLLVEIRIAIQGVDLHCFPVHVCYLLNFNVNICNDLKGKVVLES
jgi:hypothetical protein